MQHVFSQANRLVIMQLGFLFLLFLGLDCVEFTAIALPARKAVLQRTHSQLKPRGYIFCFFFSPTPYTTRILILELNRA